MKETTNSIILKLNNVCIKVKKEFTKQTSVYLFAIKGWSILICITISFIRSFSQRPILSKAYI